MVNVFKTCDSGPRRRCLWRGLACAVLLAGAASAADEPRLSPIRRTTVMTADPEASLRFWRDTLGFAVEYDQPVSDFGQLRLISPGATRGRAIALRQGDKLGGSIGLYWTDNLRPMAAGSCEPTGRAGATAVLILTDSLGAVFKTLQAACVPFVSDTVTYDQSRGPTDAFTVFDPNCVRVAFAQIARESFEQSLALSGRRIRDAIDHRENHGNALAARRPPAQSPCSVTDLQRRLTVVADHAVACRRRCLYPPARVFSGSWITSG